MEEFESVALPVTNFLKSWLGASSVGCYLWETSSICSALIAICERQVPYVQPWCLAKIGCAHLSVGLKQCTIDSVASTFLPAFRPFSVSSWSRLNCFGAKTTSSRILSLKCSTNHREKFSLLISVYVKFRPHLLVCNVVWRFGQYHKVFCFAFLQLKGV